MIQCELFEASSLGPIELPARTAPRPSAAGEAVPRKRQLPLAMQRQEQDNWCWAAVTVSVAAFYSAASPWKQCSLVCAELKEPSCCADGSSEACDRPWELSKALARTEHLHNWAAGPVSAHTIHAELEANRPLGCCIQWRGGGSAHFVAISGYHADGVHEDITIDDPFYGRSHLDLAAFPTLYHHGGAWIEHYYTRP